jgi:phage major head subunit gpT-like protein
MAEECVRLAGRGRPTSPNELVRFALSTSDFPNILANVANKTLLDAYQYASPTYKRWAKQSTVPDFKPVSRLRIGEFPAFTKLAEGGTITFGSTTETKEQYAIATYAKGLYITREMIINDDLGAIQQLFAGIGVQAAVLENATVYTVLTSNPTMSDGVALFHATHGNLAGTGGAISIATLDAGSAAMMTQKGLDGVTPLNIAPRFLIVPVAKRVTAIQFTNVPNIVVTKQSDFNPFAGQLEVIADANLDTASTTAWFLAADPMAVPTVEYAYLEGAQGPQVERVENPDDTLGMKIKAWLDFGAKAIDWRGLYKNPGA